VPIDSTNTSATAADLVSGARVPQECIFQSLHLPAFTGSNLMREGVVNIIKRKSSYVQSSSRATSMMAANAAAVDGP